MVPRQSIGDVYVPYVPYYFEREKLHLKWKNMKEMALLYPPVRMFSWLWNGGVI